VKRTIKTVDSETVEMKLSSTNLLNTEKVTLGKGCSFDIAETRGMFVNITIQIHVTNVLNKTSKIL